jgi:enoyl-CoA hydratase
VEFQNLKVETADGIATVTIDRPQSLNALNRDVVRELECALFELELDAAVKVVIITGAGEKSFVAGADIKEVESMDSVQAHAFARTGQRVMLFIQNMKKPVIAAVNGYALGGGLELALACDFIYASETAKLGLTEVTLGIMPGFGGTQNLPRLIGRNKANELIFTGKMIDAQKACAWGIVNEVFPPEDLLAKTKETAAAIAKNGLVGVTHAKDSVANGLDMAKEDGLRYEASMFAVLFATEDQSEGMGAFVAKRKASFKGQ